MRRRATVRIRHLPTVGPGEGDKSAWEIHVAPQNIDRDTGEVSSPVYSFTVTTAGDQTEVVGGNRSVSVDGDDSLDVSGALSIESTGDATLTTNGNLELSASNSVTVQGSTVKVGGPGAVDPAVLGNQLLLWFSSAQWTVAGTVATVSPGSIVALQQILSRKVTIE
jgi:hypothetical protein